MVELHKTGKGLNAKNVQKHMFGREHITKRLKRNTGLNYGLRRVTASDNYPRSLDIVELN